MHPKKHEKKQLLCTENASLCATCPLAKKTAFVILETISPLGAAGRWPSAQAET
jgi:hypothetical protein